MIDATQLIVVGISGSLRKTGSTTKVLEIALKGASKLGAQTRLLHLDDYKLVFCDGRPRDEYPEDVKRLRMDVQQAHGIVMATPEYHGSYSGVLKNAIDLMGFEEFEGKMLGLIGVAGGSMGAADALSTLRNVGRSLHAWVVPQHVSIPKVWEHFDEDGNFTDEDIRARLMDVGQEVARFAYLHNSDKTQSFLNLWEQAPHNPGG